MTTYEAIMIMLTFGLLIVAILSNQVKK
ncbi:putative holin-like toxin [Paenibacillus xylanexedens]